MGSPVGEFFAGLARPLRFFRKNDDSVDILAVTQVDTEGGPLTPPSATLGNNADAVAPTTTGNSGVDAYLYGYDGTNWDRLKTGAGRTAGNALTVCLQDPVTVATLALLSAASDALGANSVFVPTIGVNYGFNGTAWDRLRALGAADGLGVLQASQPSSTPTSVTGALGAAAVVTYAAVASQSHRLTMLSTSAGSASTLTVADGATTILSLAVPAGAFLVALPPGGIKGTVNTAMTITLAAQAAQTMTVNAAKLTA